jgi:hypothetical protein
MAIGPGREGAKVTEFWLRRAGSRKQVGTTLHKVGNREHASPKHHFAPKAPEPSAARRPWEPCCRVAEGRISWGATATRTGFLSRLAALDQVLARTTQTLLPDTLSNIAVPDEREVK